MKDLRDFTKKLLQKHQDLEGIERVPLDEKRIAHILPEFFVSGLTTLATNAWRARGKMVDPDTGEAKEEYSKVFRHIEGILEGLKEMRIEMPELLGRPYDTGMPLKVVTFEPTAGISKEEIIEVLRPAIFWMGQLAQRGEVIVGTPQGKQ